jgi:transcriptional regulator with XRE-family HTH domain
MGVAQKISKHMALKGMNQQKLARAASISDSEVSRILRGKSSPSLEYAFRLARALGVSLDYLADDSQEVEPVAENATNSGLEAEIIELSRQLRLRPTRRLIETAIDLGYEAAMKRLLGVEIKPLLDSETQRPSVSVGRSAAGRAS